MDNKLIERLFEQVGDLRDENTRLKQRIKRLEEAGREAICPLEYAARVRIWNEAKEAKL